MRILILLLISIFSIVLGLGQTLQARFSAEREIVLLVNRGEILPLKRLDTLRLAVQGDNQVNVRVVKQAAERYTLLVEPSEANLVILVAGSVSSARALCHGRCILFLTDSSVRRIDRTLLSAADALFYLPSDDSLYLDYAVQMVFGAIGAKGKLQRAIMPFAQGYGITTVGGLRLKYTIAEEVGLNSAQITAAVDSIMNQAIKLHAFPGAQLLVAVDGKVIFYKTYGFHTYDSIYPVRFTDLYDLASVTKIAASAPCLMLLYQQGKLHLDDRLGQLCRCMRHSNKDTIRLIDALTHQARLKPWIPFWKQTVDKQGTLRRRFYRSRHSWRFRYKVAEGIYASSRVRRLILRQIRRSPLLPQPGYRYSDLSFYLYPFIVKRLTGEDFEQCLYKHFYHPLGAYRMVFNPYKYFPKEQIVPTEWDSAFRKQLVWSTVHDEGAAMLGGVSGHAGLFANADDLAKLMQMYLNYGTYGGRRFLADSVIKRWAVMYQFPEKGNRRGLAFDKPLLKHPERGTPAPQASPLSFGHTGFTGTFTWADPKYKLLIVFLSNRVYPTRKNRNLIRYNVRTRVHEVFYKALLDSRLADE